MYKPQIGVIPAACDPTMHATLMTIDTVPHHLPDKTTDALETLSTVELCHAERRIIAMPLADQLPIFFQVRLSAAGRNEWIDIHTFDQDLEIARRQPQIQIKLAKKLVTAGDGGIPGVKCVDHSGANRPLAAVRSGYNSYPGMLCCVFAQNLCSGIRRTVIDDNPLGRLETLRKYRVDTLPHERGFVATRGD